MIHKRVVVSDDKPTGMGEIGVPQVAPAIANALFQLTGKRLRHLSLSTDRVKKALNGVNEEPRRCPAWAAAGLFCQRRSEAV